MPNIIYKKKFLLSIYQMKYRLLLILFLLTNASAFVYSQAFLLGSQQKEKTQKKPLFLNQQKQVRTNLKAEYRKNFTEASLLMIEENYPMALKKNLVAQGIDPSNANINYRVALCYLKSATKKDYAIPFLEKASLNVSKNYLDYEPTEKKAPISTYYYLGIAYHLQYRFDEAITNFELYKSLLKSKEILIFKDVNDRIKQCQNAKALMNAPINVAISNMGDSVNGPFPDYCPVISADESTLIFTSRRAESTGGDRGVDNQFYEDIYICYKKNDGKWTSPVSISSNINTYGNDAAIGLSADGQQLLIYRDDAGDGNIYTSTLAGDTWSVPEKMGSDINTKSWEPSASISADGNTLFFVSDREGGFGGRDIWRCVKLPNGKWSLASNLGAQINTEYDEEAPFIHPDGVTLLFSSSGHKTMGGFDIFSSVKNPETGWEEPVNMGFPINTTNDDVFYVTSPDGKRGYYSSAKPGGYGEKDIYLISLPDAIEKNLTLIKGVMINPTGKNMSQLEIAVLNNETGEIVGKYHPLKRNGSFVIVIPANSNYKISYLMDGSEFKFEDKVVPAGSPYSEETREIIVP